MKVNHALVFSVLILGLAFLAYKNMPGLAGMMQANSDGSAQGGPIYSSQKANVGQFKIGGQAGQQYAGKSNSSPFSNLQRYVRGQ
jgi:hypothetical protein